MTSEVAAESLASAGVMLRRGKLGGVLLVDFRPAVAPRVITDRTRLLSLLKHVEQLERIREIYLTGLPIQDVDVESLVRHLPAIQVLDLEATEVSDRVFEIVSSLGKLKMLVLTGTQVSEESVRAARKHMIQTRIVKL